MTHKMERNEVLKQKLTGLKVEHRDLDRAIEAISAEVNPDRLTLGRLKKRKLQLRDEIKRIEDEITPDIIA